MLPVRFYVLFPAFFGWVRRGDQYLSTTSHSLSNSLFAGAIAFILDVVLHNFLFQFPTTATNFQAAQTQLNKAAEDLNIASNDLVGACRGTPTELAASSNNYNDRFTELLDAGLNMAGQSRVSKYCGVARLCALLRF